MNKKRILIISELLLGLISLTSCTRIAGNSIDFYKIDNLEDFTFRNVKVNLEDNSYELLVRAQDTIEFSDYAIDGGDAPRYGFDIKEGYENIENYLYEYNTLSKSSVIYTKGYLNEDGYVYGICNYYYKTIGYLSGGGNYGEEEIAYSIYYKYDVITDNFECLSQLDNSTMVSFNNEYVIYWKNKYFYSYNILNNEDIKICKHLSYDSGIQHQSLTDIYFNDEYVIFSMKKSYLFSEEYHLYLYKYGEDLIELSQKQ